MKHPFMLQPGAYRRWLIILFAVFGWVVTAQAQVKGTIFRDFDLNGVRSDTLPIEVGVAGVTVRAFVDLSKIPIQTTTDATGKYSFNSVDVPAGKLVRIELDQLPTGDYNGPYGLGSGTSVQFVKAPAEEVNVGINYPADYCQSTGVRLVVPCYVNGNTQITTDENGQPVPPEKQAALSDAIVSIAYEANGVLGPSTFPPDHLATGGQVGAVWAVAYQRRTKKIFSAAMIKRHMSLGPLGTGGIYQTDIATQTTTPFLDVKTLGIDTGDDPHSGLFGDKTQTQTDPGPMTTVAKLSIGGMDMAEDDKTLYFINLKDRKLYGIFINSPTVAPTSATSVTSWTIPDPGCSNGDFRPWALKIYHGKIYVGVVCSAETSQQQSDLKATIYRFDPTDATPVFAEVLSFPLDFQRGPVDVTGNCIRQDHWLPWSDTWPTSCGTLPQFADNPFVINPQPIVADLEFDIDGSMIIGFMDRFGHLSGVANHNPQGSGGYVGFTGGDILRAYTNNGTFELEKNGQAGNLTGSGAGNNEGPVDANNIGGEFFGNDSWLFHGEAAHSEVTNGSLILIPGYNEVVTTAFDPITNVYQSGGLKVFDTKKGASNRNSVLYTLSPGSFGKAAGLGDIDALCDPATVEIGNRVWFDDNRDGIQDAYEPGIDGVVLTLHNMQDGGRQIATQITYDGGQFYFNNSTVPGGLQYGHKYEIRMNTAQLSLLDITLTGTKPVSSAAGTQPDYSLSPADQTGFVNPDLRDSDAHLVGESAVIAVTTLDAGQNDFTNDLGIYSCPALVNEKDTIELCSGTTLDLMATVGRFLSRVDSVRFVLFSSPQSGTAMYESGGTVLGTVKADSNNRAVLANPSVNTTTTGLSAASQYIYAIIYPTPANFACRPFGETVVKINPPLSVSASGGKLTCTVRTVTLGGTARNGDGSVASAATYAWTGPGSFTSSEQNPSVSTVGTYTLTVNDPACPGAFRTTTTDVTSDTVAPVLTTSIVYETCPTCQATLTAEAPGATIAWSGPNGYTVTGSPVKATAAGVYTVTAMAGTDCLVSAQLQVRKFICPTPNCLPINGERIK